MPFPTYCPIKACFQKGFDNFIHTVAQPGHPAPPASDRCVHLPEPRASQRRMNLHPQRLSWAVAGLEFADCVQLLCCSITLEVTRVRRLPSCTPGCLRPCSPFTQRQAICPEIPPTTQDSQGPLSTSRAATQDTWTQGQQAPQPSQVRTSNTHLFSLPLSSAA